MIWWGDGILILPLTIAAIFCVKGCNMATVSELTVEDVANYLRLDDVSEIEEAEIEMFMDSAKAFLKSNTGLTYEEIDDLPDMVHPYLLYISEQFDNRNGHIENKQTTKNPSILETIRRHSINYV